MPKLSIRTVEMTMLKTIEDTNVLVDGSALEGFDDIVRKDETAGKSLVKVQSF
jgi:hypothetical protein